MRCAVTLIAGSLLGLSAASQAAEVKDAATAIRIAKAACRNETEHWFARRHGDQWDVFPSRDGVERECMNLRVYIRVKDGSLVSQDPTDPLTACIICAQEPR